MDLSTEYLGLTLRNPLVASASPLSKTVDGVRRLADAGVGAVVLYSLFEEQVRQQAALDAELAEAERLHGLAEESVALRWDVYEEMATRGAHGFPADGRKDD